MNTQSANEPVSMGICAFCNAEFSKNKMTQHLKFCKQRQAASATLEAKAQQPKTRLFHILAEGRYNPQYWLHFEVPASASLWHIDSFLKDMWIDDLDHLSGFTINGTNYGNDYSGDYFFSEEEEEEELSEEEIAQEIEKLIDEATSQLNEFLSLELRSRSSVDLTNVSSSLIAWLTEIGKHHSVDELVDFLKKERTRLDKEGFAILRGPNWRESLDAKRAQYRILSYQKSIVGTLLDAVEDRSLEVSLARALKVGQKFSYIYDYGSSTYINLKVLREREGIAQDEKDPVQLLAQNVAPEFPCIKCGKPATRVKVGYYTRSIADGAYCDDCTRKKFGEDKLLEDDEIFGEDEFFSEGQTLPITNSPRAGVL